MQVKKNGKDQNDDFIADGNKEVLFFYLKLKNIIILKFII